MNINHSTDRLIGFDIQTIFAIIFQLISIAIILCLTVGTIAIIILLIRYLTKKNKLLDIELKHIQDDKAEK